MTAWGSIADLLGEDLDDIELLGRGSSGSVYRATQRSLGRTVAVKVFRSYSAEDADRVLTEARAQAALSWHANVVSLYGQGITPDGFPYLVMEYAPGGSLADRVTDRGPMAEAEFRRMGSELADALSAAHDSGLVHCDVKPSNVLFAADGSARLADFGIARATGITSGTLDSIEGSLVYVPPELLDGERPVFANDVYSLALTVRYAATGRAPYDTDGSQASVIARIHAGPPTVLGVGSDGQLRRELARCLSRDPERRPSAAEVRRSLASPPEQEGPLSPAGPSRQSRLALKVAAAVALVALVAALLGFLAARSSGEDGPTPDLCADYEAFVRGREEMFLTVSEDLELEQKPYETVRRILVEYPTDHANRVIRFLDTARTVDPKIPNVTTAQLVQMSQASVLRDFSNGKAFLFDGESGEFDPTGLPPEVREPAEAFSAANGLGESRCDVVSNITPGKARMRSAIFSNLADADFMNGFFEDQRSKDLLGASFVTLMADMARGPMEVLLHTHWDWVLEFLLSSGTDGQIVVAEHPDLLLTGLREEPGYMPTIVDNQPLLDALAAGLQSLSPSAQEGVRTLFGPQLLALGTQV